VSADGSGKVESDFMYYNVKFLIYYVQ
jgi:hypothetical protein